MWPLPFRSPLSPLPSQYFHIHCSSPKVFFPPRVMSILACLFLLCLPLKEEGKVQILSIFLMVSYLLFHEYFQFLRLHFYRELPNFFPRRLFLPLHCKSLIFTILSTLFYLVNFVTLPLVIKPLPPLISADPQTPTFHKCLTYFSKRQGIWYLIFNRFNRNIIKKSRLFKLELFPLIL